MTGKQISAEEIAQKEKARFQASIEMGMEKAQARNMKQMKRARR